ncbi:MAG TPA: amino acid ABC transporter permease, partial [Hydrogenophaga sp.]|nr:amino acid ABC transporter permease [Hydrogenophaga sp.]
MSNTFVPIPARPSPVRTSGLVPWIRTNMFADWRSSITSLLLIALVLYIMPGLFSWGIWNAVFATDAQACQDVRGTGACWGVVAEKYRIILLGRYPFEEQWRPVVATSLMVIGLIVSCIRVFWKPWLAIMWVAIMAIFFTLMGGGVLGLSPVRTDLWGGLPLTVLLATVSI